MKTKKYSFVPLKKKTLGVFFFPLVSRGSSYHSSILYSIINEVGPYIYIYNRVLYYKNI